MIDRILAEHPLQ